MVLPNGWKVVSVSSSGVTVDDGGVRKNLGFSLHFSNFVRSVYRRVVSSNKCVIYIWMNKGRLC